MEIAEEKSLQGKARTFIFLLLNLLGWPVNKTIQVSSTQSTAHPDRKPRLQQAQQSHDAEGWYPPHCTVEYGKRCVLIWRAHNPPREQYRQHSPIRDDINNMELSKLCKQHVPTWAEENNMCLLKLKKNHAYEKLCKNTWLFNQNKHKSRGLQAMGYALRERVSLRCPSLCTFWVGRKSSASIPSFWLCLARRVNQLLPSQMDVIWTLRTWVCYPLILLCDVIVVSEWLLLLLGSYRFQLTLH